ncbi:MAG: regulatory protein RecX, partial [Flavobacteriaceae bacterium]|nr:regulatory protein RecX [Flavobacteriaceae bacterium]
MYQAKKTYTVEEALVKLQKYCAYQDRCHREVEQKLKQMHMIPEAIERVIVDLIQDNHLNEERFAKAYVRGKFSIKKWGKVRLTLELKQRQISQYVIKTALAEIDPEEYLQTFHKLAEKKALNMFESNPFKRKKKLADYLIYRGWESHMVYDKVNALI